MLVFPLHLIRPPPSPTFFFCSDRRQISWESDISKKDENLTATASIAKSMPPPRNSAPGPAAPSSGKEDGTAQRERAIPGGQSAPWIVTIGFP